MEDSTTTITTIIFINSNIENEENKKFINELESISYLRIKTFKNVNDAINYMKNILFVKTKVIVSGELYIEFINSFNSNINDINVLPKIVIFTKQKESFINLIKQYGNIINNPIYYSGGIKTSFQEIKQDLVNPPKEKYIKTVDDNIQMTFEYIDKIEKLALPLFYKTLIEVNDENINNYTNFIYKNYSNNKTIKDLFEQIIPFKNIPIQLLCKYYIRAYTIESNFYSDINKDLGFRKKEAHLSFIKTLYEGSKLKALPLTTSNILYRGSKISKVEIEKIKLYIINKIKDLPAAIVFSNSFLSFSKDLATAEYYLTKDVNNNKINNNNMLAKVLYTLLKEDNMDYSLSTHCDLGKLSIYPNENEVLFFPFSTFEIKEIKEILFKGEKIYEIRLLYLGKYLKEIEKKEIIKQNENILPNSEFQKQIIDCGLIQPKKIITNNNPKKLYDNYRKYKNEANNILPIIIPPTLPIKEDQITELFIKLYNKGLVTRIIDFNHNGMIVAKKFIISQKYLNKDYNTILREWIPAWHGARINYLGSIISYGLKKPDKKVLYNSYRGFQPKLSMTDDMQNWQNAIFASPRILCAADPRYSDRICNRDKELWCCLLDVRIKPNTFTKHSSEVLIDWQNQIQSRNRYLFNDIIYRITSEDNITILAITFLLYDHLIPGRSTFQMGKYYGNDLKLIYEDDLILKKL